MILLAIHGVALLGHLRRRLRTSTIRNPFNPAGPTERYLA